MMQYGIYSVQDGAKLIKILIAVIVAVSIVYFLFGRKTSHDIKDQSHDIKDQSHDIKDQSHDTNEISSLQIHTPINTVNLLAPPIPDDIISSSEDIHVNEGTVSVKVSRTYIPPDQIRTHPQIRTPQIRTPYSYQDTLLGCVVCVCV